MRKVPYFILIVSLIPLLVFAQEGKVRGVVTDSETDEPLAGVNVTVDGTNLGTATDQDGYFVLENLEAGEITLVFEFIGYATLERGVTIGTEPTSLDVTLVPSILYGQTITVEVNRAEERKTPVTFSTVDKDELSNTYATQDVPDLLKNIPGVFTSTAGLGESEISIRGFDAEHVQVLINGIPENDPESQKVYWSNWTGLSGNASSIQVQRGVGASLMGSGSFGGSVNILTDYYPATPRLSIRGSLVSYNTTGGFDGTDRSATGLGGSQTTAPSNQLWAIDYSTGWVWGGNYNFYFRYERKSGDSYINNTYYNGHSFYFGARAIAGDHVLTFAAHGAPQRHNQARISQDRSLIETLGREYNRNSHPYQENYYFKPQFELHDDWAISETQFLKTNAFFTFGTGGGRYLRNDNFITETGEVGFKEVSEYTDWYRFGRNARQVYDNTGFAMSGYDPVSRVYTYGSITDTVTRSATDLISGSFDHSWRNDSQNHHVQFGFNTAYNQKINEIFTFTVGGELRHWKASHYAESFDFRHYDPVTGEAVTVDEVQRRYDYDGIVTNYSGFGRLLINPNPDLTFMIDGQYASYTSSVEENAIRVFDFGAGRFTNASFFASKNTRNPDGSLKYSDSDYERTFNFFMPKIGANYNVNQNLNVFANYSISKKEPKVGDWYDRSDGPGALQAEDEDLKAETLTNIELGLGYRTENFAVSANFYTMSFEEKIESVTNQAGDRETINAGESKNQGVEVMANAQLNQWDAMASISLASNEWEKMGVQKIFGEDAEDVKGKVVPYHPEQMLNGGIGYTIGNLRFGLGVVYWDNYYTNYTNKLANGSEAKLPAFFELNAVVSYTFKFNNSDVYLRLNLNNLTNKDNNFQSADWTRDFNRNDDLGGVYTQYVMQSPLFHTMFTAEIQL